MVVSVVARIKKVMVLLLVLFSTMILRHILPSFLHNKALPA